MGGYLKLAEPEAAFEIGLEGPEGPQVELAAPPHLDSREGALDQLELYWMSLLRDVHFANYADDLLARRAAEELGASPETLFRGESRGDSAGPYLSQLLYLDVAQFPLVTPQRFRMPPPGIDYQVAWISWLAAQNGLLAQPMSLESEKRYVRTGRDLAEYVRRDFSYQAFLNAALILLRLGVSTDGGSLHKHSRTQASFSGFGSPLVLHLVATIAQPALRLCWYYKWLVHRRLRPEEWGGLLESPEPLSGLLFDSTLTDSVALDMVRSRNGSRLLPLAYPEGCPAHPSFPAGHAVVAGACATVLKAYFDESFEFPATVEASADGLELIPRKGVRLSVGGEIDKLAANISFGRNFAGIHYRSDSVEGLRFGERLALDYLRELKLAAPSDFAGWSVRTFDGKRVDIH